MVQSKPQHLKQLLLLLLLCPLALGQGREDLEPLHRNKRTLTTICVEIQPSGPQNEPYFMCKGADFSSGAAPAPAPAPQVPQAAEKQQQPIYNFAQPGAQMTAPQAPFPSFPSFSAGFFQAPTNYEDASNSKAAQPTSTSSSGQESHGAQYGSAAAAAFAPASAPQSYGLPAVSYPAPGGPQAAPRGTLAGPSPAATPTSYADPGAKKPSPVGQTGQTPMRKSQSSGNPNEYQSLMDGRHRVAMDDGVLGLPNVGFQPEELNAQYRRPVAPMEPPMMLMQLHQPAPVPHPHYDDHIMRTFYESLGHQEPQVAQAAPSQQAAPIEQLMGQVLPSYAATAPEVSPPQPPAPPTPPPPPPAQPIYNGYEKPTLPLDGNACNSCNRPCSAPAENCPSFQPVIIAMPCYGQQQPTHYLAVPGSPVPPAPSMPRESIVAHPFGATFGMAPQVGAPFGGHFGIGSQGGPAYGMSAPQVGAPFGMGPQVGGPFGMAPIMNPFGPFGHLNPFNPFNRILGAQVPTTPQPRLRIFGEASTPTTTAAASSATAPVFQVSSSSSTTAPPTRMSTEAADDDVGAGPDDVDKEDEDVSQEATELPQTTEDDDGPELSKSLESKDDNFDEVIKKSEDKLKSDKRKRQNSRFSNSNSQSQKRKYIQRL
ncbi:hypothetical protein ACLKA6_000021 [Drosophila palustris]